MRPRGLQKAPNDGPEASGGRLLSPRRVMLRLVELLGAIRDLQECSRELPGTLWGALGELSGSSWGALGTSWGALGRLLGAFWVRKSSSVAESLLFRESSSRLHGSIDFEVWRGRKWARNRSLGIKNDVGRSKRRKKSGEGRKREEKRDESVLVRALSPRRGSPEASRGRPGGENHENSTTEVGNPEKVGALGGASARITDSTALWGDGGTRKRL